MINEVNDKLIELIDLIDNNPKILRLKYLKDKIYEDNEIKESLEKFRSLDNQYCDEYVKLKKQILDNSLVKEYKILENELYFCVLEINKKLNTLLDRKKCS